MKYSSCMWPGKNSSLGDAEDAILSGYCEEARLGLGLRGVGVSKEKMRAFGGQSRRIIDGENGNQNQGSVGREGEGLRILDLGCGWGSLGLFLAEVSFYQITLTLSCQNHIELT